MYTSVVTLDFCSSLYGSLLLLWSGWYSGMCIGTSKTDASPSRTSFVGITKSYSAPPPPPHTHTLNGVRGKGKIKQRSWWYGTKSIWDAIRSTPGACPPRLSGRTRGTSKTPALVRDRLSPTREGKLLWRVCLHPHLQQGRTLRVERNHSCGCHFFLSYKWELAVPEPLL